MVTFMKGAIVELDDMEVMVIDTTHVNEPTSRERFWIYKLDTFVPNGSNLRLSL